MKVRIAFSALVCIIVLSPSLSLVSIGQSQAAQDSKEKKRIEKAVSDFLKKGRDKQEKEVAKTEDQAVLFEIAVKATYSEVAKLAAEKVLDQTKLVEIAESAAPDSARSAAIKRVDDQAALAQIAAKDTLVARAAAAKVTDRTQLVKIAKSSASKGARSAAIERVEDQTALAQIAAEETDYQVAELAAKKVTDQKQLVKIAESAASWSARREAVRRVDDQTALAQIATKETDDGTAELAVEKVTDQKQLVKIAESAASNRARRDAVRRVDDQNALAQIAAKIADWQVAEAATKRITDENLLPVIAQNASVASVRATAIDRIADQTLLAMMAVADPSEWVRRAALRKITDPQVAASLVHKNEELSPVRSLRWGMSPGQVEAAEGGPLKKIANGGLILAETSGEFEAEGGVTAGFSNEKLVSVGYFKSSAASLFFSNPIERRTPTVAANEAAGLIFSLLEFEGLNKRLVDLYGPPTKTVKADKEVLALTTWDRGNVLGTVVHIMIRSDSTVAHVVGYAAPSVTPPWLRKQ